MRCRLTDKTRGGGDNVHSPPDLSLPDVTARVTPRTDSLLLFLSIPLLYIHSLSIPSLYLCSSSKKKRRGVLHQLSGPSAWCQTPPSISLSPLFLPLSFSPPLVVTEHTCLILATRAPSPITSQPLQSHPPDWIFGSRSHLSSLCLDSAENR